MLHKSLAALVVAGFFADTALGGVFFFNDKGSFEAFNSSEGKFMKGIEDFEEATIPDGAKQVLPAPLQGNVPNFDPVSGFGFQTGLLEKNLIIQDNITPGPSPAGLNPSGLPNALFLIGGGFIGNNSKKIGEDLEVLLGIETSLDLIFTEPNHTGVGFDLSHFTGFVGGFWTITIYNKGNGIIGTFDLPSIDEPGKNFFGVWSDETIGRINIWDSELAPDAIDNIQMWIPAPGSLALLGLAGLCGRRRRR